MRHFSVQRVVGAGIAVLAASTMVGLGLSSFDQLAAANRRPALDAATARLIENLSGEVSDLKGKLAVSDLKLERLSLVSQYSAAYRVPADVAGRIYDAALAEGLHPSLGFQLVKVESGFRSRARSPQGAMGYTQVLLSTAREIDPTVTPKDLLDPDTNLRIGFRILKRLLRQFDQDLEMALRAYNMGPTGAMMSLVDSAADSSGAHYSSRVMKGIRRR